MAQSRVKAHRALWRAAQQWIIAGYMEKGRFVVVVGYDHHPKHWNKFA